MRETREKGFVFMPVDLRQVNFPVESVVISPEHIPVQEPVGQGHDVSPAKTGE